MVARIYSPAKSPMQSGQARLGVWVLQFEPEQAKMIDPLMGYTSTTDMKGQIRLQFDSCEAAIAYARAAGLAYRVEHANQPKRRRVAYSDNFKSDRFQPWTH